MARAFWCYTQKALGEVVTATAGTISKLETGKLEPSENLLLALSKALHFEPEFFSREVADEYRTHQCSFRHLQSTPRRLLDQALARGTFLHEALARLSQVVELPKPDVPDLPAETDQDIDSSASAAREYWGLGVRAPITNMVRVAEHAGVVLTRLQGITNKVDAFSRYGSPPTIVLTSTRSSFARERFNVAHELGHLIIHRNRTTGDFKTEQEANRFAEAFLLPRQAFGDEFRALARIDWPHIYELKRRWKVEGLILLHRACHLGLVDPLTSRRLYKQYSWKGWHKGEPYDVIPESPELLPLALNIVEKETGQNLRDLAGQLHWDPHAAELIAGLPLPPVPLAPNVKRLADYR